jgi:hypothetical protein
MEYACSILPSAAVTVTVIHVFGPAMAHVPVAHAPADDEYTTVALTSAAAAVTAVLVVPFGTCAAYDVVLLTNAGDRAPGVRLSAASRALAASYAPRS